MFTANTDHASYVFSSNLGSGHAKYVADATSHEAGHTLSLEHDGTSTAGYYSGHGSWGPIMGTPYSRAVTQWSLGQYPDANNTTEDDLAEIGARGGFRSDDHADTTVGATVVSAGTRNGFIGVGSDVDVFQFTPTGGSTQVTVTTPAPATNLLARLTVRDDAGGIVTEVEPSVASGWSLTAEVPASAGAVHRRGVADLVAGTLHRVRHLRLARRLHHHLRRLLEPDHDPHALDHHHDDSGHHHDSTRPPPRRRARAPRPRARSTTTTTTHDHHDIEHHDLEHHDIDARHHIAHHDGCADHHPIADHHCSADHQSPDIIAADNDDRHRRLHRHARTGWR